MITTLMIIVFVLGYMAIAFEHPLKIDKAASALLIGGVCWALYAFSGVDIHHMNEHLSHHLVAIAEILLARDKEASEGKIAPRFNSLVRKETCAAIAESLELGPVIRLGRSEMLSGGRSKQAILGDAMEAILAAVYLDSNFEITKILIDKLWYNHVQQAKEDARDSKTALQEWAQSLKYSPPVYTELSRSGPDHGPIFTIEVRIESGETAIASSSSKQNAQQAAAKAILEKVLNG